MKISKLSYPLAQISSPSHPNSSSIAYPLGVSCPQSNTFEPVETLQANVNTYVHKQPNHLLETASDVTLDVISRTLVNVNNVDTNCVELCESYSMDTLWDEVENQAMSSSCSSPGTVIGDREKINVRKRCTQWTEDEHKLFILGLKKYGKGDWKSISRNFVTTRSGVQVASHAQKFFKRHESTTKRKRNSIHDITIVDNDSIVDLVRKELLPLDEALSLQTPNPQPGTQAEQHYVQQVPDLPADHQITSSICFEVPKIP